MVKAVKKPVTVNSEKGFNDQSAMQLNLRKWQKAAGQPGWPFMEGPGAVLFRHGRLEMIRQVKRQ